MIAVGEDRDGNGKLEGKEIKALEHICLVSAGDPLFNVLVIQDDAAVGACPAGGKVLRWGHDLDRDGKLSAGEVQGSTTVCHGKPGRDGLVSIVSTWPDPPGPQCAAGGSVFRSGLDRNGNGALNPDEGGDRRPPSATERTAPAAAKARRARRATPGAPGMNALFAHWTMNRPGQTVPAGGVRVRTGLDLNRDGTLDEEETTQSKYVCHGVSAPDAGAGDGRSKPLAPTSRSPVSAA